MAAAKSAATTPRTDAVVCSGSIRKNVNPVFGCDEVSEGADQAVAAAAEAATLVTTVDDTSLPAATKALKAASAACKVPVLLLLLYYHCYQYVHLPAVIPAAEAPAGTGGGVI